MVEGAGSLAEQPTYLLLKNPRWQKQHNHGAHMQAICNSLALNKKNVTRKEDVSNSASHQSRTTLSRAYFKTSPDKQLAMKDESNYTPLTSLRIKYHLIAGTTKAVEAAQRSI